MPHLVKIPDREALREIVAGSDWLGFPQVARAIDETHTSIVHPKENSSIFCNWKKISLLYNAGCGYHWGIFTDIYIGWLGRVHGACVLVISKPFQKVAVEIGNSVSVK